MYWWISISLLGILESLFAFSRGGSDRVGQMLLRFAPLAIVCRCFSGSSLFLKFATPSSSSGQESAASRVIFALTYFLALRSTMPKGDRPHSTFSVYHCTNAIEKRRGKRKNINIRPTGRISHGYNTIRVAGFNALSQPSD